LNEATPTDRRGIALVVLSAILFSAKAIFVKLAYPYGVDAITLLSLRMAMALPFFVVIAAITERRHEGTTTRRDRALVALLGAIGYWLASYLDYAGLAYVTASLERVALFAYPTFTVLIDRLVFGRRIGVRAMFALVLSYVGIAIALGGEARLSGHAAVVGTSLVLASALVYAGYLAGAGRIIPRYGSMRFVSHALTIACVVVILHFLATHPVSSARVPLPVLGWSALTAIVSTVVPTLLLGAGIRRVGASEAAIAGSIGPVSTLVMGAVVLGESVTVARAVGSALVLFGVTWMSVARGK
jgi:drug/metabolite transporter (DMT)-like permease